MSEYIYDVLANATVLIPLFLLYLCTRQRVSIVELPDMTKVEYEDALALCISWLETEAVLIGNQRDDIKASAFYNMATFNLCKLNDIDKVFKVTDAQRTLVRLVQLYLNVCFRYGKKRVDSWSNELQETLIKLGQNEELVRRSFIDHPYLIVLPALNIAASTKYAKKF